MTGLQTQLPNSSPHYSGPINAVTQIIRSDGIRGMYAGQGATVAREFHGYGMYFLAYEALVQRWCHVEEKGRKEIPVSIAMVYGAAAGYAMWLSDYPIDVIKSRMQADPLRSTGLRQYRNSIHCTRVLWKAEGWKGFVRGLTPTLIRYV